MRACHFAFLGLFLSELYDEQKQRPTDLLAPFNVTVSKIEEIPHPVHAAIATRTKTPYAIIDAMASTASARPAIAMRVASIEMPNYLITRKRFLLS